MKNGKIINLVNNDFRVKRETALRAAEELREKVLQFPDVAAANAALTDAQFALAKKEARGENADAENAAYKKAEIALADAYKKHGVKDTAFTPAYACRICKDTGVAGNKYCKCFEKRYYEYLRATLGIEATPSFTFADANFDVIKDEKQREYLKKLYAAFERYAEKYPSVNTLNAIVTGGTGVGKSCLMSAVANRLTERGFSVMYVSSVMLNKLMLNYHTANVSERGLYLDDIMNCDMLIIDDLGSEQIIRNVTVEYLLMILNVRELRHKPVFITTNLTENELKTAYPERIFSRLANKKTTTIREIIGCDLRLN